MAALHICHFIDHLDGGGGQEFIYNLINQADDERFSHSVCYLKEKNTHTSLRPKFEKANIPVTCFHAESRSIPHVMSAMIKTLRTQSIDLLHMHTVYAQIFGRLVRPFVGIPHSVSTYHMMPSATYPNVPIKFLERSSRWLDDQHVAVSNGLRDAYRRRWGSEWQTIYNGIDVAYYHDGVADVEPPGPGRRSEERLTFVNIGRFVPEKSQSDLVIAMEKVVQSLPGSELFIIGGGELEDKLRQMVVDRGIDDHVHLIDHVDSVLEYYALADVFVLSSIDEGLPLVVLEAMAAGLPVVATDIQGVDEVVVDGETGFLVPPQNPTELASKMVDLESPDLRQSLGQNGYERVAARFDLTTMVTAYQDLYETVCSG